MTTQLVVFSAASLAAAQGAAPPPAAPDETPAPSGPPPPVSYPEPGGEGPGAAPAPAPATPAFEPPPGTGTVLEPPPPPPPQVETKPVFGIGLGLGLAFGGEDLVTAEYANGDERSLDAGDGVVLSANLFATPLWAGKFGFGLGAEVGWKYTALEATNGGVTFARFPLVLSLHALLELSKRWYLLGAGGTTKDLGATLSGDGIYDAPDRALESNWGWLGELGVYYKQQHTGACATLRYTGLRYEGEVDASNVGLFGAAFYDF